MHSSFFALQIKLTIHNKATISYGKSSQKTRNEFSVVSIIFIGVFLSSPAMLFDKSRSQESGVRSYKQESGVRSYKL